MGEPSAIGSAPRWRDPSATPQGRRRTQAARTSSPTTVPRSRLGGGRRDQRIAPVPTRSQAPSPTHRGNAPATPPLALGAEEPAPLRLNDQNRSEQKPSHDRRQAAERTPTDREGQQQS